MEAVVLVKRVERWKRVLNGGQGVLKCIVRTREVMQVLGDVKTLNRREQGSLIDTRSSESWWTRILGCATSNSISSSMQSNQSGLSHSSKG